jgi:succinate dehydrogenase / fumarate reductase, cytochrome b subunit
MATGNATAVAWISSFVSRMRPRPLSPHLSLYRFGYTMTLSILHRMTGLALSAGMLMLAWWLVALAWGESVYRPLTGGAGAMMLRVVLALWLVAFLYHLANGIRHLCWDAGLGLERSQARRSARLVVVVVAIAAAALVYAFFIRGAT